MAYILCVDDEPSISALIRHVMKAAGHEVAIAPDGFQALASVEVREPDLIILDRSMPGMDGLDVCRSIKANPFLSRVPVLMLTALAAIDFKIEGFDAGADDYLAKPFEPRELLARVAALLRLVAREGDRNPSSGLPGGRAINSEIESRITRGERFCVVYFDLDYFKPFADTFGFAVADSVIVQTGQLLGEIALADGDFVGHIGGDDFLLVCSVERAEPIAQTAARRFKSIVDSLVAPEVAERERFLGLNRDGVTREFPLAGITSVIVPVEPRGWVSVAHLGETAATWKRAAKANGSGQIIYAH